MTRLKSWTLTCFFCYPELLAFLLLPFLSSYLTFGFFGICERRFLSFFHALAFTRVDHALRLLFLQLGQDCSNAGDIFGPYTVDVPVDLPVARANPQPRPDKPVYLSLKSDLTLSIGNDRISETALAATLATLTGSDREQRVFLRADKSVPYGELMQVMNLLRAEGYL